MSYKVQTVDFMRQKYGACDGLEGPFNFSGRALYYDPIEGAYWDPTTDFFVSQEEMNMINGQLLSTLKALYD